METINITELRDKNVYPTHEILRNILQDGYSPYLKLLALFEDYGFLIEWRYYNDGKSWLCKVQKKNKTILWMSAWPGYMQATIYLPERYINDVYKLSIDEVLKNTFKATKNVGKSKPLIFKITEEDILENLRKVIEYKVSVMK